MADERNVPDGPERGTQQATKTRAINIPLKQLPNPAEHEDEFCHRFQDKLKEDGLGDVMESLKVDKQLDPVHVVKRKDSKWEIVCGHRRVASMYLLAGKGLPGFSMDMQVQCLEVIDASHLALMKRSIADNELGKKLDAKERLVAVKKLGAAGATKKEIAVTLGVGEKSIGRDLKIVKCPRMLQHVLKDHIPPTTAAAIAEVASPKGRLDEFLDYLDGWTKSTKRQIDEEDVRARQERGKGLRPNQMLVMNRLEPHLAQGWLEALAKGKPLTEEPDLGFEATFDKKTAVARIKLKVDARNDDVQHLVRVAGQVSQVAKNLAAFAKKRYELESPEGPQAALRKGDAFLDMDMLKEFGLEDLADQLTKELRGEEGSGTLSTQGAEGEAATEGT